MNKEKSYDQWRQEEIDDEAAVEPKVYYIPETIIKGLFESGDACNRILDELFEVVAPQALEKDDEQR